MKNIWDEDDLYCSIGGFVLIIFSYFFTKYFWKWWNEIKSGKPSINQSNALQGAIGGVFFFITGLVLLYYSFLIPILTWLKR
jgi:uncharacterized membrane protein YjfL (UPF0719 family)